MDELWYSWLVSAHQRLAVIKNTLDPMWSLGQLIDVRLDENVQMTQQRSSRLYSHADLPICIFESVPLCCQFEQTCTLKWHFDSSECPRRVQGVTCLCPSRPFLVLQQEIVFHCSSWIKHHAFVTVGQLMLIWYFLTVESTSTSVWWRCFFSFLELSSGSGGWSVLATRLVGVLCIPERIWASLIFTAWW